MDHINSTALSQIDSLAAAGRNEQAYLLICGLEGIDPQEATLNDPEYLAHEVSKWVVANIVFG